MSCSYPSHLDRITASRHKIISPGSSSLSLSHFLSLWSLQNLNCALKLARAANLQICYKRHQEDIGKPENLHTTVRTRATENISFIPSRVGRAIYHSNGSFETTSMSSISIFFLSFSFLAIHFYVY